MRSHHGGGEGKVTREERVDNLYMLIGTVAEPVGNSAAADDAEAAVDAENQVIALEKITVWGSGHDGSMKAVIIIVGQLLIPHDAVIRESGFELEKIIQ